MSDDLRCCENGNCIVDAEGHCWCGQQWDGEKMCHVQPAQAQSLAVPDSAPPAHPPATSGF